MEKAILKTLIYADIFDYPLKVWELHKWLIGKKTTLIEVEKGLKKRKFKFKIRNYKGYYYLKSGNGLVKKRLNRESVSKKHLSQVQLIAKVLKIIPWIKLVGISGSLAMENSTKLSDIDLFVITTRNRLWLSRFLILSLFAFIGKRRRREETEVEAAGKFCLNLLLDEEAISLNRKDLYAAHEILQMKVIWDRDQMYSKFLSANEWVFKYLPNWVTNFQTSGKVKYKSLKSLSIDKLNLLEQGLKWLQTRYMGKISGDEKIKYHSLFFHPQDKGFFVMKRFKQQLVKLS